MVALVQEAADVSMYVRPLDAADVAEARLLVHSDTANVGLV